MQVDNNNGSRGRPDNEGFANKVERVVSMAEYRRDSEESVHGPLNEQEISSLSMLCSAQSLKRKGTLSNDLGFADVDPTLAGLLVEFLQKHVTLASSIDLVKQTFTIARKIKEREVDFSMDQWLRHDRWVNSLRTFRMGLEAAAILLFVVNSPGIDPSVVNEDSIEASIALFRHHLTKNILPALNNMGHITAAPNTKDGPTRTPTASAKKRRRSSTGSDEAALMRSMKKVYPTILGTVGLTVLVIERLEALIQRIPLDDQLLLSISSGALMSLELDPSKDSESKLSHQLHVASIGVVTSIFRKYPRHRQIIVEDLFPVMLKMPTYKRSMRTYPVRCSSVLYPPNLHSLSQSLIPEGQDPDHIQTISAIVMSLVQSAVVQTQVQPPSEMEQDQGIETQPGIVSGLMECQAVSDMFVQQLLQRCSKKGEDGGASEFRPILSNLIDDLLLVLLVPEYPAADMILLSLINSISKELLSMCASTKAVQNIENTYLNTVLDALGKICAAEARILKCHRDEPVRLPPVEIREASQKHMDCYCDKTGFADHGKAAFAIDCDRCHWWYHGECVGMNHDAVPEKWHCDACQLGRIVEFELDRNTNMGELGVAPALVDEAYCMRRLLIDYLSIVSRKSGAVGIQDAYEFHLARWLNDLAPGQRSQEPRINGSDQQPNTWPLITRLIELWDPRESFDARCSGTSSLYGMLQCISDAGRSRIVVHLASRQSHLLVSHRSQIGLLVTQLMENESSALLRKLAVKAIEKVTDADQKLMLYPFVKKAVSRRFSDEAISVREAAVSLVGMYVVHSPAVANAFHPAFMVGLNDPGISVRKRTIKTLQDIMCTNPTYKGRATACSEMLRLAADPKEDDGVRDTIYELFWKVWLEGGDDNAVQEVTSPETPCVDPVLLSPGSKVLGLQYVNNEGVVTPAPKDAEVILTPSPSQRETRSTERKYLKKRLQVRSEVAVEQMVEVVKASNTGEYLTALFRELVMDAPEGESHVASSSRKKQRRLQDGHCAMLVDAVFEILLCIEESKSSSDSNTDESLVAVMRTVRVFTDVSPSDVLRHIDTLLPYLKADNDLRFVDEAVVVGSLCEAISQMAFVLEKHDVDSLSATSIGDDLVKITYKYGRDAISSAVRALSVLAHHHDGNEDSPFRLKLLSLARTFYEYLLKHKGENDFATMGRKVKANVQRALSVLGSICRYHDSLPEEMDETEDDGDDGDGCSDLTFVTMPHIFELLFSAYLTKSDAPTKCAALRGLCGVFISQPRKMLRMDQSGLIAEAMSPTAPTSVQLESLLCWREILLTEESRIESGEAKAKMESKSNITLSKRISGDQDADATLFGGVLSGHASRLFEMTQDPDKSLRYAALDLVGHLLRQGQINPNETVPFLLALQGDIEEDGIRSLALKLLTIEGERRPDMLRQRVFAGIKQAYAFQKTVYPSKKEISALVAIKKNGVEFTECVFGRVFKDCIASMRKQRRGLFASLLSRFDPETSKEHDDEHDTTSNPSQHEFQGELPLLSFTSQVLAYLPYKVPSDPLFIIYTIASSLSLRGPDLLDRLACFLRPYGLSSSDDMDETNYDEDTLEVAAKRKLPHDAKQASPMLQPNFEINTFASLCAEAAAYSLLLRLKDFLREAYDLSESRVFGFNPDAKDDRERAISKASQSKFNSQLPMQQLDDGDENHNIDCMIVQYAEFRRLMRIETYSTIEKEDDDEGGGKSSGRKKRAADEMD